MKPRALSIVPVLLVGLFSCSTESSDPPANNAPAGAQGGAGPGVTAQGVTYHEHLEPLLQKSCQSCHREGGIGSFPLATYEQARDTGPLLLDRVVGRQMPPWGAFETPECKPRRKFAEDIHLTGEEIDVFRKWVEGGMPQGDPAKAPKPVTFEPMRLKNPTLTLSGAAPHVVKPGKDDMRCIVIDPGLTEDMWIDGTDVMPDNSKVVHHVLLFADAKREALKHAAVGESYPCFGGIQVDGSDLISAWAPGVLPAEYPAGTALELKKGSLLVMQMHYHPQPASDEPDLTKVALRKAPAAPDWVATVALIGNASSGDDEMRLLPGPNDPPGGPAFVIPPDVVDHTEKMEYVFPDKIGDFPLPQLRVASVGSHMHWVGRKMRIEVERAKETEAQPKDECFLETPQWDFNWQRGYAYDTPIEQLPTLNAGDKIKLTCTYDNSMSNPFMKKALADQHLTSPKEVRLGEETLDEMCLGAFVLYYKNPFKN